MLGPGAAKRNPGAQEPALPPPPVPQNPAPAKAPEQQLAAARPFY